MIDEAGVREKFGVGPSSIPDYLALVGDTADGFPGLPGWGAKSAGMVLARYEHIDRIPDDVAEWDVQPHGAAKLAATLAAARDAAKLFLDLATLRTDADVGEVDDWEWRGPAPELEQWAERLGAPGIVTVRAPPRGEAEVGMEHIELVVGEHTFSALADGRSTASSCSCCTGSRETSYEWRAQIPVLGGCGVPRGRARPARIRRRRAAGERRRLRDPRRSSVTRSGSSTRSVRRGAISSATTGAVPSAWVFAVLHPDRLRTLTAVSTPHPTPFGTSIREGEQKEMSAYMDVFRAEGAEDLFLADGGAAMRRALASFGMDDTDPVDEYYRVLSQPGAMTGALNWYRANDFGAGGVELPPVTVPTMYVWSTDDQALGREAAEATAPWVTGPYRFEVLEGVSHWVPEEVPDVLERAAARPLRQRLITAAGPRFRRSWVILVGVTPPVYRRSGPRVAEVVRWRRWWSSWWWWRSW